tara:strand:+ start:363 stop:731 length:369 start_codon:yes stop_codon:yes gene_type:complete
MIGFASVGVKDLGVAGKFYDELLSVIGVKLMWKNDRARMYGLEKDHGTLCLILPYDEKNASPGNGSMVAIVADSIEKVNALHKKSLEIGALNEGDPGERSDGFYGSYIRDLDRNKLCFYCRP